MSLYKSLEYNNGYFFIKINYYPFEKETFKGYLLIKNIKRNCYFVTNNKELSYALEILKSYYEKFDPIAKKDFENLIDNINRFKFFKSELNKLEQYLDFK